MAKSIMQRTLFDITYRNDIENVIRELNPLEWAYIYHDKDVLISGEVKKPHYHIWARFETPVRKLTVSKILGLSDKHLPCTAKSQKACIRYMTHETKDAIKMKKYKYSRDEIKSNIERDDIERIFLQDDDKLNEIRQVLDLIYSADDFDRFMIELLEYNLVDIYNKYYNSLFRRIIKKVLPEWKDSNE